MYAAYKNSSKKWLQRLEVEEYANRKLETLSKGNQQKVQLAATLVSEPDIVILDEPFSGLDPVNSQILKDVVRELIEEGRLVIFSSHQMSYVEEFCEDIVVINHGNVVLNGSLKDIKKEYGKNRITVSFDDYTVEKSKAVIQEKFSDYVTITGEKKEEVILQLQEGKTKSDVMESMLKEHLSIATFGNYAPSLNEIFVMKAGDE